MRRRSWLCKVDRVAGVDKADVAGARVDDAVVRLRWRVQSSGFRVQDSGCRVQGSGFRVQGRPRDVREREWGGGLGQLSGFDFRVFWGKTFSPQNRHLQKKRPYPPRDRRSSKLTSQLLTPGGDNGCGLRCQLSGLKVSAPECCCMSSPLSQRIFANGESKAWLAACETGDQVMFPGEGRQSRGKDVSHPPL